MSSLSMLGILGGRALSRTFGRHLLARTSPMAGAVMQKKPLTLTPANSGRVYGPQEPHEKHDDRSHWLNERYVAIALIPLIPTALLYPNAVCDMILCGAMVLHSHWRLSGVCSDYIHGSILPKIHQPLVLALSIIVFGCLTYFNYMDIGFARAVRMLYTEL